MTVFFYLNSRYEITAFLSPDFRHGISVDSVGFPLPGFVGGLTPDSSLKTVACISSQENKQDLQPLILL